MADFENQIDEFRARETTVVAASVDPLGAAENMRDDEKLSFEVAHSLDRDDFAERFGAYFHAERGFLHATGFVVEPNGTVAHAVYATGSIGRLEPGATLRAIDYLISQSG